MLKALRPVNYVLDMTVKLFCFIFRINLKDTLSGADELRGVIEHQHQEGNVFKEDREMLDGILDISAMTVASIMVHRSNMSTIDASLSIKKIVSKALSTTHTRIPVFKGTEDNIIGVLHLKNLLKSLHENNFCYDRITLRDFITEPWFIPCNSLVNQQLHEFKKRKTHFALVVDEYGEIKGLVTLEDVLEEIVGQIDDEHDEPLKKIEAVSETEFILHGGLSVRDLNREMGWELEDESAHTIAGFIIAYEKRLPEQGESFTIQDIKFTIQKRVDNKLKYIIADTSNIDKSKGKDGDES
jgi:Mg2+/Co2+ transporter CorB